MKIALRLDMNAKQNPAMGHLFCGILVMLLFACYSPKTHAQVLGNATQQITKADQLYERGSHIEAEVILLEVLKSDHSPRTRGHVFWRLAKLARHRADRMREIVLLSDFLELTKVSENDSDNFRSEFSNEIRMANARLQAGGSGAEGVIHDRTSRRVVIEPLDQTPVVTANVPEGNEANEELPINPIGKITFPQASIPQASDVKPSPINRRPSPRVFRVQILLKRLRFDPGPSDGVFGKRTLFALQKFYDREGIPFSSDIDKRLITLLLSRLEAQENSPPRSPPRSATNAPSLPVGAVVVPPKSAATRPDGEPVSGIPASISGQELVNAEAPAHHEISTNVSNTSTGSQDETESKFSFLPEVGRFFGVLKEFDEDRVRKYCRDNPDSLYFDPEQFSFTACE